IATLLATSLAGPGASSASARTQRATGGGGYCRNAGPLPTLPRESINHQNNQMPMRAEAAGVAAPPPPASPTPRMAAPALPSMDVAAAEAGAEAGADDGAGEIIVTSAAIRRPESTSPSFRAPPRAADAAAAIARPPRAPNPVTSGVVTAGEHDDILNPELYAQYVRASQMAQRLPALPVLDTSRLLTVRVADANGRGVPFANVTITCNDGHRITMATQADGTAIFFPDVDRLSPNVIVGASYAGRALGGNRRVDIGRATGVQNVGFSIGQPAPAVQKLDLMLVVDATGSMGDEINYLKAELQSIVTSLQQRHAGLDVRVGFVFYRDTDDDFVTQTVPFTRDMADAQGSIAQIYAGGGGDFPEAMDQALIRAVGQSWRADATKTMLLVADAPPHDRQSGRAWAAAEAARAARIQIVPVAASGVEDQAEYIMRAMAAATQSRYLFLTNDSGVGADHAAPSIDCYLVTRLDALLRRVIDSQISGRRIEPASTEVIRTVGVYDAGRCTIPTQTSVGKPRG
ncbi:MAG: vWA domain-containing protein, partial [Sphingopyxis sp.]